MACMPARFVRAPAGVKPSDLLLCSALLQALLSAVNEGGRRISHHPIAPSVSPISDPTCTFNLDRLAAPCSLAAIGSRMPAPAVYVLAIVGTVGAVLVFKEVGICLPILVRDAEHAIVRLRATHSSSHR